MIIEWEKLIFNFTNSKFFNLNLTRSKNTTATSAHVKKESNSTLKYAPPATTTQQYSYKQGCGIRVPDLHVLERSRSTFLRFDEVGVASNSRTFRFGGVGNRSPYCFWRIRLTLNNFTFLYFISIFIVLTLRKVTIDNAIDKASNYPDLLLEMPRYCCPIENFYFAF